MLAVFARSASFLFLLCFYAASFQTFLLAANVPPPQSRIEDRTGNPELPAKKIPKSPKRTVWNLDGGVFFSTDGHLQNGSCFRLSGEMTAPDFFNGLRRVDTSGGATYTLHDKVVTEYPPQLQVILHLLDFPCTTDLKDSAVRPPLTREIMSSLRLNFFWKQGIAMRPVESSKRIAASARPLAPYSADAAAELAPRFEWNYIFTIASEGVPLTNDLVLIIEDQDRKIAARVAARL
jgi:hypothetical protein